MIPRSEMIGRLRAAEFHFVEKTKRTELYRNSNGPHYVNLPFRKLFTVEEASLILRQAGLRPEAIETFLKSCIKQ